MAERNSMTVASLSPRSATVGWSADDVKPELQRHRQVEADDAGTVSPPHRPAESRASSSVTSILGGHMVIALSSGNTLLVLVALVPFMVSSCRCSAPD